MEEYKKYKHDLFNDLYFDSLIFKNKENGYFVEIGACNGKLVSQSWFFEKYRNWKGIVVEPNPYWHEELFDNRNCNIETFAISNESKDINFIKCEVPEFSYIDGKSLEHSAQGETEIIKTKSITLLDLFNKYNTPSEIDFVSIDAEGSEFDILESYFKNKSNYKVNVFAIETDNESDLTLLFKNNYYQKIRNPFLSFLRRHPTKFGIVRFSLDDEFINIDGTPYEENISDLLEVDWEHYYIHTDFLSDDLKKLLL